MTAGTATLTLQDTSLPSVQVSTTLTAIPATAAAFPALDIHGAPVSVSNPVVLTPGGATELTVVNQDTAGNPVPVVGTATKTWTLPVLPSGEMWENGTGGPITSVSLTPGQTTASVWLASTSAATLGGVGQVEQLPLLSPLFGSAASVLQIVQVQNSWGEALPNAPTDIYVNVGGAGYAASVNGAPIAYLFYNETVAVSADQYGYLYLWNVLGGTITSVTNPSVSTGLG